jgi:hypothetical protein
MACLIIGIIWTCIRFIASTIGLIIGVNKKDWGCLSWFMWIIGWLGNIALLIIGACTV